MLIAQLSDLHVRPRGQLYKGVADSNRALSEAIDHLHGLDQRPDLVLLSGDLVDEGHADEYAMALELLRALTIPYLVVPGNHDNRENFRAAFRDHIYLPPHGPFHYCIDDFDLKLVVLDSCLPGQHHGSIDAAGLSWLQSTLAADPRKPTLVVMHHPPFVCGIAGLDVYRLVDSTALEQVMRAQSNIEAVLCGHTHRAMVRRWAGTVVMTCPSTVTEIGLTLNPGARPHSSVGPSACLLHLWNAEHGLVSHTSHIGQYDGPYPFF